MRSGGGGVGYLANGFASVLALWFSEEERCRCDDTGCVDICSSTGTENSRAAGYSGSDPPPCAVLAT